MNLNLTAQDFLAQVNEFFSSIETEYPGLDFKVRDFMRTDTIALTGDAKLSDAIKIIVEDNIDTVPIVDHRNALIGVVTQKLALREINRGGDLDTSVRNVMKINPGSDLTPGKQPSFTEDSHRKHSRGGKRDGSPAWSRFPIRSGRASALCSCSMKSCKTVLQSAHSGIISVDKDLRIQITNAAGERMLKITEQRRPRAAHTEHLSCPEDAGCHGYRPNRFRRQALLPR